MEWLASHPDRFIPEENAPDTYRLRGCSVPHRRSKRFGERNLLPLVGRPARSLVTIPTELLRVPPGENLYLH